MQYLVPTIRFEIFSVVDFDWFKWIIILNAIIRRVRLSYLWTLVSSFSCMLMLYVEVLEIYASLDSSFDVAETVIILNEKSLGHSFGG